MAVASRAARSRSPAPTPDRKSTRLNSSHLVISYAVFCLKKKNTHTHTHTHPATTHPQHTHKQHTHPQHTPPTHTHHTPTTHAQHTCTTPQTHFFVKVHITLSLDVFSLSVRFPL